MQFSIGTFNILHPEFAVRHQEKAGLIPGTKESNWKTRKVNIGNEIAKANLDVVCLQEISQKSFRDLQPAFQSMGYTARHAARTKGDGLAILYKDSCGSELSFKIIDVSGGEKACFIDLLMNGKVARIANCHLQGGPLGTTVGVSQIKNVAAALDAVSEGKISLQAVLGDFNEDSTRNNKKGVLTGEGYATDGASVVTEPSKNRQIDWIFVRPQDKGAQMTLKDIPIPSFPLTTSDHHLKATMVQLSETVKLPAPSPKMAKPSLNLYDRLKSLVKWVAAFFQKLFQSNR